MNFFYYFVCVGVMYSGEYDVCDVTLSVRLTFQLAHHKHHEFFCWTCANDL
jgi:hypothetical protein